MVEPLRSALHDPTPNVRYAVLHFLRDAKLVRGIPRAGSLRLPPRWKHSALRCDLEGWQYDCKAKATELPWSLLRWKFVGYQVSAELREAAQTCCDDDDADVRAEAEAYLAAPQESDAKT